MCELSFKDYIDLNFSEVNPKKIRTIVFDEKFKGRENYPKRIKNIIDSGVNLNVLKQMASDEEKAVEILLKKKSKEEKLTRKEKKIFNKSGKSRFHRILFEVSNQVRQQYLEAMKYSCNVVDISPPKEPLLRQA